MRTVAVDPESVEVVLFDLGGVVFEHERCTRCHVRGARHVAGIVDVLGPLERIGVM